MTGESNTSTEDKNSIAPATERSMAILEQGQGAAVSDHPVSSKILILIEKTVRPHIFTIFGTSGGFDIRRLLGMGVRGWTFITASHGTSRDSVVHNISNGGTRRR